MSEPDKILEFLDSLDVRHWAVVLVVGAVACAVFLGGRGEFLGIGVRQIALAVGLLLTGVAVGYLVGTKGTEKLKEFVDPKIGVARALASFGILGLICIFSFSTWLVIVAGFQLAVGDNPDHNHLGKLGLKLAWGDASVEVNKGTAPGDDNLDAKMADENSPSGKSEKSKKGKR